MIIAERPKPDVLEVNPVLGAEAPMFLASTATESVNMIESKIVNILIDEAVSDVPQDDDKIEQRKHFAYATQCRRHRRSSTYTTQYFTVPRRTTSSN